VVNAAAERKTFERNVSRQIGQGAFDLLTMTPPDDPVKLGRRVLKVCDNHARLSWHMIGLPLFHHADKELILPFNDYGGALPDFLGTAGVEDFAKEVKIRLDGKHRLFRLSATIIRGDGEPIPTFSAVVDHDEITNVTAGPQQRLALPAHKIIGAAIARDNALGALETMRDEEHRVLVLEESEQRHEAGYHLVWINDEGDTLPYSGEPR